MNSLEDLKDTIDRHSDELRKPGVVLVYPGYKIENDWPTREKSIVVVTSQDGPNPSIPSQIEGHPVTIRRATDLEQLSVVAPELVAKLSEQRSEFRGGAFDDDGALPEAEGEELTRGLGKPRIPYAAPQGISLKKVSGTFPIICHVSPDAGWPTLREFLRGTESSLTVGIYDFTSGHILEEVSRDLAHKEFEITLDNPSRNPTADQTDSETIAFLTERLGRGFESAWALVRTNKAIREWIYPTAYHIKVAVRDGKAVWCSSGNWNNSNQPDMDPIGDPQETDQANARKSDRDWHVIIEHSGLAEIYEAFLHYDYIVARREAEEDRGFEEQMSVPEELRSIAKGRFRFHPPLRIDNEPITITPLLTPDPGVYQSAMLRLLQSAERTLYIQLQYIHPSGKPEDALSPN